ncbi:MAG: ABC transporter ATP-binding protein, partial [Candidatus Doudnabacteria bacterium]|nr:ABC transporter ATP-binding protein [Candidatus Doudnabacteria bacterium]
LMGLLKPDSGRIEIFGEVMEGLTHFAKVYSQIGFLPSEPSYYNQLTARQMFSYAQNLHVLAEENREITDAYSERLKLDQDKQIAKMSLGNKRKVGIILSLIANPKLIVMDEPTSGLDPLIQHEVLDILEERAREGSGILLSSHNLPEIESICDRLMVIKDAHIVFTGTVSQIRAKKQKRITFEIQNESQLSKLLKGIKVAELDQNSNFVTLLTGEPEELIPNLLSEKIYDFTVENPTLEEMFISYYK